MSRHQRLRMRWAAWLSCLVGLMCVTDGCQASKVRQNTPRAMSHFSFMSLWETYAHCRTSHDPEAIFVDALRLNQALRTNQPELPRLLHPVKPYVSDPPSRLAVDPEAMAASCMLRAGQTAMAIGWNDLAVALYQSLLRRSSDSGHNYYVRKAREELEEVQLRRSSQLSPRPASSERPPTFVLVQCHPRLDRLSTIFRLAKYE